eukprot:TRINITY_DN6847_c0_g1_i1.p1 TRINITY_DN6847_c0_g1~~TRINITY_DN6847_c0_g1_i1.p1  ORF type:complete len:546 (+),score=107.57 TRINITY_DN6847_c0_g1_i1:872-2509(+)
MGMNPIATALLHGADVVLAGRTYDPACFAALPILRGFDVALSLHMGKILECGAIACEPGIGSDCLVCDLFEDQAFFWAPNENLKTTAKSLSAHTLYEKVEAHRFGLPGGVLFTHRSEFREILDFRCTSLNHTEFLPAPLQLKLEGAFICGHRVVSVLLLDSSKYDSISGMREVLMKTGDTKIGNSMILCYGVDGVEAKPIDGEEREMGILVKVFGKSKESSTAVCALIRSTLLHFGYPGRKSTAGNLAFPFSPSDFDWVVKEREFFSSFICGTRDPIFISNFRFIMGEVLKMVQSRLPNDFEKCTVETEIVQGFEDQRFLVLLETVAKTKEEVSHKHDALLELLEIKRSGGLVVDSVAVGLVARFSMHHLMDLDENEEANLFKIFMYQHNGACWENVKTLMTESLVLKGSRSAPSSLNPVLGDLISDQNSKTRSIGITSDRKPQKLSELASVIRSKNAGVNALTFDIMFDSVEDLEYTCSTGIFTPARIKEMLRIDEERVLGCFKNVGGRAVKITIARDRIVGDPGERDVYGAQQARSLFDWLVC